MNESYVIASLNDMKDDYFDFDSCEQFKTKDEAEKYIKDNDLNKDKEGDDVLQVWTYEGRELITALVNQILEGIPVRQVLLNLSEGLSFEVKDGLGLNSPVIKVSNGDEVVITGMSYKDQGDNRKDLSKTDEMEDHYTDDFILTGVGGKKYVVTREVTIYKKDANVKGGRFKSKIVDVQLNESAITEGAKFTVGKEFSFRDKYGNTKNCKVIDRKDLEDEDDYAVAEITYQPRYSNSSKTVRVFKSEQSDSYGDEYFVDHVSNGIQSWVVAK